MAQSVVVEVVGPNNERVNFKPLGEHLTGRVQKWKIVKDSHNGRHNGLPETTPGICIQLDYDSKSATVFDPVADNEQLQEQLSRVPAAIFTRPIRKRTEHDLSGENDLATWHHWTKRIVDDGYGQIISGRFPPDERVPGRPRINLGAGSLPPGENEYGDRQPPRWYVDRQLAEAKGQVAGKS